MPISCAGWADGGCLAKGWIGAFVVGAASALMAKISWILLTICIFATVCLYNAVQFVLGQNAVPASLEAYPGPAEIEEEMSRTENQSSLLLDPPLRTKGRFIIDKRERRFKLVSVNWYGASDILQVPGGLDVQHRDDIALTIRRLGFNSVRLPYADQMVKENPIVPPALLLANGDLVGSRAVDVFNAVVKSLTGAGIAVIINNHITQARWCCDANPCDGTWSNSHLWPFCKVAQSEEQWIQNWVIIMTPLINDPLVVGMDLRNEVRGLRGSYLWNRWATAAENAAERLHQLQPNWLIVVEGVQSANDISGARPRPIEISVPDRLVYSSHVYGWHGWGSLSPYWKRPYESFKADIQKNWAYLLDEDIAPVWVGEFGAPEKPNGGDLHYWKMLMKYLGEKDVDFGYWALNPRKPDANEVESYGLVEDDWSTLKLDYRLFEMSRLRQRRSGEERLLTEDQYS